MRRSAETLPLVIATAAMLAFSVCRSDAAETAIEEPGMRIRIDPADLPEPYATPSEGNSPDTVPIPNPVPLRAPAGFAVNLFAGDLDHARWLAVAPNGDVFLAEPSSDQITVLRDADGDGKAETRLTFADGFARPHGLAFHDGHLYVADTRRVWRIAYADGDLRARGKTEPVTGKDSLGSDDGHWTRNIAFSPDSSRFYVAVGSNSNLGEEPLPHASVQEFQADGSGQRTFASGLRNPVGIAFYPGTDDLYVVVNERDGLGDELVPDYLTRVEDGGFYGWPYAYLGPHPQPKFAKRRPDLVERTLAPDLLFRSHSAPLGLVFYDATQFPEEFRGDGFVAMHGSWNAGVPRGYFVARVPFENGRPAAYYEVFLSGFRLDGDKTAKVWGRPVGLAIAKDGSLLVADDIADAIWRVSYRP